MAFEHYIRSGQKWLRQGYTTGTCAALAAAGATRFLLTGSPPQTAALVTPKGLEVEAPLLALVPIPAFTMEEATVNFNMEVKDSTADKITDASEGTMESSLSIWGFSSTISGKVTTSRENTRSSDKSAKYDIYARAAQQPAAEGMAKLSSIFASVIEPITTGSGT